MDWVSIATRYTGENDPQPNAQFDPGAMHQFITVTVFEFIVGAFTLIGVITVIVIAGIWVINQIPIKQPDNLQLELFDENVS